LIQERLPVSAEFSRPAPVAVQSAPHARARTAPKRTKNPEYGGPSKPAVIVAAIFALIGAIMLIYGFLHKFPPNVTVRPEMEFAIFYEKYISPIVTMLVALTLWMRAHEPGITFFRGLGVVVGSSMLYTGITMPINFICHLGFPKDAYTRGALVVCVISVLTGYFLMKVSFRPRIYEE